MASAHPRFAGGLTALALAILPSVGSGCVSPALHQNDTTIAPYLTRDCTEDVETIVQRHRTELEALADLAKKDDIERGGVIIAYNGTTKLIEIHNQFRDGPDLIDKYCQGELHLRGHLDTLITSAVNARIGCNPSGAANYYARADNFRTNLTLVQVLVGKDCQTQNYLLHTVFSELALHRTYLKDEKEYHAARRLGEVLFHVHTHNDTRTAIDDDTTDSLAPSRQDLLISQNQQGIVTGVDAFGNHRIYYSNKGTYRQIEPETTVALR